LTLPLLWWTRLTGTNAPDVPGRTRRALQFPIGSTPRIAVVAGGFSLERNAREFAPDDLPALHQWSPDAIVAPLETALSLADQRLRGVADLPNLRCLVVLTDLDGDALADDYRELLWQAFQVPIFEQLRGADGAVIARECEAHDGLHLDPSAHIDSELRAALMSEHCECGSEAPRLKNYRRTNVPNASGTWNDSVPVARQAT
jgi:hypothetical protein